MTRPMTGSMTGRRMMATRGPPSRRRRPARPPDTGPASRRDGAARPGPVPRPGRQRQDDDPRRPDRLARRDRGAARSGSPRSPSTSGPPTSSSNGSTRRSTRSVSAAGAVRIRTFHALGREILRAAGRPVEPLVDRDALLRRIAPGMPTPAERRRLDTTFSTLKLEHRVTAEEVAADPQAGPRARAFVAYERALAERGGLDFDDLVARALALLESEPRLARGAGASACSRPPRRRGPGRRSRRSSSWPSSSPRRPTGSSSSATTTSRSTAGGWPTCAASWRWPSACRASGATTWSRTSAARRRSSSGRSGWSSGTRSGSRSGSSPGPGADRPARPRAGRVRRRRPCAARPGVVAGLVDGWRRDDPGDPRPDEPRAPPGGRGRARARDPVPGGAPRPAARGPAARGDPRATAGASTGRRAAPRPARDDPVATATIRDGRGRSGDAAHGSARADSTRIARRPPGPRRSSRAPARRPRRTAPTSSSFDELMAAVLAWAAPYRDAAAFVAAVRERRAAARPRPPRRRPADPGHGPLHEGPRVRRRGRHRHGRGPLPEPADARRRRGPGPGARGGAPAGLRRLDPGSALADPRLRPGGAVAVPAARPSTPPSSARDRAELEPLSCPGSPGHSPRWRS